MINHNKETVLSIIIPTKNRQYTALYAIASATSLNDSNIEIIVQDCSDNDILKDQIREKFGNDKRIKYYYTTEPVSMTENWNLAIEKTSGRYLCAIGDDDAVLPGIMEVVCWMRENNIDSTLPPKINYTWKDAQIGSFSNSRLTFSKIFDGNIYEIDLKTEFYSKIKSCGFGYTDNLPNIYHAIISKAVLLRHKAATGDYMNGTSLDAYCAFALVNYIDTAYYIDYPFTIRGSSGKSNSNRIITKQMSAHFDEIKSLKMPDFLPAMQTAEVSIAESMVVALEDTKKSRLIKTMNLAIVYGKCAALEPLQSYRLYKKYAKYKNTTNVDSDFLRYYFLFMKQRIRNSIVQFAVSTVNQHFPHLLEYFLSKISSSRVRAKAIDISEAVILISAHIATNRITLGANRGIKKMAPTKDIWA